MLLPAPPLALAASGHFVLAVSDDGIYVHERSTGRRVQVIDWAHDDAWVRWARPCNMLLAPEPSGSVQHEHGTRQRVHA